MGLRDVGETLPPGFRFFPSDEELVCHYLYKKIANEPLVRGTLVEIDLHVCEPWQLPDMAKLNSNEWYFFSFRDRKYATGYRTNRATTSGYWKATGKDRSVLDPRTRRLVGMRKTLVFYRNRAPNGIKTGWIMHEFRLENPNLPPKEDWVLCRVFYKSRSGVESSNTLIINSPHDSYIPTCPSSQSGCQDNTNVPFSNAPLLNHHPHHHHGENLGASPGALWAIDPVAAKCRDDHGMNESHHSKMPADATAKSEYDEYGLFLLDFDGSMGVPSSIQAMQFGDDNSSVFV